MSATDLVSLSAVELGGLFREGLASPRELMEEVLARVDEVNPVINALCAVDHDRALRAAKRAGSRGAAEDGGLLHGIPVSIKDTEDVEGMRTTFGATKFAENLARQDSLVVARIRAAGGIPFAKSNTPEFAAGINTTNQLFGSTKNPWDLDATAGGSSGGAAAGVAAGLGPLAHATDHGCSVRLPASFNGLVGLRPSPGRVPQLPTSWVFDTFAVTGPLARTVDDCALLYKVMRGADSRVPVSFDDSATVAGPPRNSKLRVAWSSDLGIAAVEPEVAQICREAVMTFERLGWEVEETAPSFDGIRDIIDPIRAVRQFAVAAERGPAGARSDNAFVEEYVSRASQITAADVGRAEALRNALWFRMSEFFDRFDLLVTPTTQTAAFPIEMMYPTSINGAPMGDVIDACLLCYAITMTGLPALSIPAGYTSAGMPVGLQLIGRPRAEDFLFDVGRAYETASGVEKRIPPLRRSGEMAS
ncbi:amidase [Parafrigoribacterium humi]|uniref:amidase n=1 Tax=Parafrigoribacterium humi TaxID=3144664 RepID=UPI0032EE0699